MESWTFIVYITFLSKTSTVDKIPIFLLLKLPRLEEFWKFASKIIHYSYMSYVCLLVYEINLTYIINYILGKGDQFFKFIGKFKYLGIESLP